MLSKYGFETNIKLMQYAEEIETFDMTNREAHAAKVYFNSLFGKEFSRDDVNSINAALNYGYGILLSNFNKEIDYKDCINYCGREYYVTNAIQIYLDKMFGAIEQKGFITSMIYQFE